MAASPFTWRWWQASILFLVFTASSNSNIAEAAITPFMEQSFYFDYNDPLQPYPVPVTTQCQTIHITWQRSTATGPNPTAPYYLQVYTSTAIVPFIIPAGPGLSFDWAVPFAPNTLYQICMFDKNGYTGGCQATYTVIPAASTPTCANVTYPPSVLNITAEVDNGPLSQYGWIDQCTDISLTPNNGTPPYTFTVAPALHPPYNITGKDMSAMNWTVSLSWASPFFISVVDAVGNSWSNGQLHSGGSNLSGCLAGVVDVSPPKTVKPVIAIGSGIGGLFVGLLAGILAAYVCVRVSRKRRQSDPFLDLSGSAPGSPHETAYGHGTSSIHTASHYRPVPSTPMGGVMDSSMGSSNPSMVNRLGNSSTQYHVEPFVMPGEQGQLSPQQQLSNPGPDSNTSGSSTRQQGSVYVVHHDSGGAPVTVFHEDGTQVVELPPRYLEGGSSPPRSEALSGTGSDTGRTESDTPGFLLQPRRPALARKPISDGSSP